MEPAAGPVAMGAAWARAKLAGKLPPGGIGEVLAIVTVEVAGDDEPDEPCPEAELQAVASARPTASSAMDLIRLEAVNGGL